MTLRAPDRQIRELERRSRAGDLEATTRLHRLVTERWVYLELVQFDWDRPAGEEALSLDPDVPVVWGGEREYSLFAYLAGVRNRRNVVPISVPRGFPLDLSPEVEHEAKQHIAPGLDFRIDQVVDFHTPSWLLVQEILLGLERVNPGYKTHDLFLMCEALAKKYGGENVRMVFWFDN